MVNPILAGSIALMISTGAGMLAAPKAAAYLDAHAHGWCGAEASAGAHAKTRRAEAEAEAGAKARAARWLCDDADGDKLRPHAEAREDDEACEEHGSRHRRHASPRAEVEARASAEVEVRL
ncbi:MAG TPA: hypothetical protein VNX21_00785 [Candidatus Thermoplasmatota archaeon]|nr:hypothetical protein [Candidatus Thermoplasmatota archaeon]